MAKIGESSTADIGGDAFALKTSLRSSDIGKICRRIKQLAQDASFNNLLDFYWISKRVNF